MNFSKGINKGIIIIIIVIIIIIIAKLKKYRYELLANFVILIISIGLEFLYRCIPNYGTVELRCFWTRRQHFSSSAAADLLCTLA